MDNDYFYEYVLECIDLQGNNIICSCSAYEHEI